MTLNSPRWRNLGIAGGAAAAVLFCAFDLYQWIAAYAADHFHNDFTFYEAAARIGLAHGWASIYDLELQQAQLNAMGSGITIAELARYISPPPLAWLAVPFTVLPYGTAYGVWSGLLLVSLGLIWRMAAPAPDSGRVREILLAAAIGWLPVIYGLQLGQPAMFVGLGVAGSYALIKSGRPFSAGLALGAIAFKPQLAFLVPPALLAAGRYRAAAGSVVALGTLGLASVIALGWSGVGDYLSRLSFAASVPVNRELTLAVFFGSGPLTRAVQVLVAAWTLFLVFRLRDRGPEWIFACALAGGMLATPYVHLDDLAMLGLAAWLCLRANPPRWTWAYALALVVIVEGEPIWGPLPVIAAEVVALALLSVVALTSRDAPALPRIDARPLELHPKR
ncbi:MAG TPA: glycosyltransferase family 87 protein [Candidatus Udaeobacter sp.]|nr:glycosyltransferase family 87 protein [Candidatus Udaeobacter sp.]